MSAWRICSILAILVMAAAGTCIAAPAGGKWRSLVSSTVTVGSGGGGAEVKFTAKRGQRIRIHLKALETGMEPYGYLESASGGEYHPANDTGRNGENSWEGKVADTGSYTLTVFDGTNRGGPVAVTVEEPAQGAPAAHPSSPAIVQKTVTVRAGGGAAKLEFTAKRGQRIRIRLKALDNGVEPYGFLESASGGEYRPANETAKGGENMWEGALPDNGSYSLTIFDGSNRGGRVNVLVEPVGTR